MLMPLLQIRAKNKSNHTKLKADAQTKETFLSISMEQD